MKTSILMVAMTAVVLAAPTFAKAWTPAEEARLSADYTHCVDAAAGATPATIECTRTESAGRDADLNRTYRATLKWLAAPAQAALRKRQRAWIHERDATCQKAWDEAGGGEVSELEHAACVFRETIARTMILERSRVDPAH